MKKWTSTIIGVVLLLLSLCGFIVGGHIAGWDFSYFTNPNTIMFFVLGGFVIFLFVGFQIYKHKRG